MERIYAFVSGPLAWIAWTVFVVGSIYRIWHLIKLAKEKEQVLFSYISLKYAIRSIINWSIPWNTTNMRLHPIFVGVAFLFHIGFFLILAFLSAHVILLEEGVGIGWPTLPDLVADVLAFAVLGACIFFGVRRVVRPEVAFVTDWTDFALLGLVAAPFLTGILAYHQWGDPLLVTLLHILSAELLIASIPFTRLSHMLFAPFTRGYIGSEFGMVRHVKDW